MRRHQAAADEHKAAAEHQPPRSSAAARLAAKRAAKAAAKASKKGTAPIVPERLSEGVSKASGFYAEHQRLLWSVLVLAAVGAIAWFAVAAHFDKTAAEAADLLGAGVDTSQALVLDEGETAPEGVEETYPTARDRAQKALDQYRAVLQRFPEATAATWAKLGEATTLLELGQHDEASKAFGAALTRARADGEVYVEWRALEGLGFALEAQEKPAEAAQRFEELAGIAGGDYKVSADYHHARMLVAQGKKEEAAKLLEAMIKAERERPPEEGGPRFDSVLADAETLLDSLATELGKPKLEPKLPATPGAGFPGQGGGQQLSPEIMEMLRNLQVNTEQEGEQGAGAPGAGEPPGGQPADKPEGQAE